MMRYLACAALVMGLTATAAAAVPRVISHEVLAEVQPNSSVMVTETIAIDFGGFPASGISRELPLVARDGGGSRYRPSYEVLGAFDEDGQSLDVQIGTRVDSLQLVARDAGRPKGTQRVFVIRYRIWRAVRFLRIEDEFHWEHVALGWPVPVTSAACTVTLPSDAPYGQTSIEAGLDGASGKRVVSDMVDRRTARFTVAQPVQGDEKFSVTIRWPKGVVTPPGMAQEVAWFLPEKGFYLLPPLCGLALLLAWWRGRREPVAARSEMVTYEPPDGLSPAEMGTLLNSQVDLKDVTASIVDLAVRGRIQIIDPEQSRGLLAKPDYALELLRDYDDLQNDPELTEFERYLIRALFCGQRFTTISGVSQSFHLLLPVIRDMLYDSLVQRGYYTSRPDSIRGAYCTWGFLSIILGLLAVTGLAAASAASSLPSIPIEWGFSVSACGLLFIGSARFMPRKTRKGNDTTAAIKGFQEYICRTERQHVEWQEQHSRMGKLLPYAIALGVRDKWEQAFRGVDLPPRGPVYAEEDNEPHRLYMASSFGLVLEIGRLRQQLH